VNQVMFRITQHWLSPLSAIMLVALIAPAQNPTTPSNSSHDGYEKKTYVEQNGTWQRTQTIETEHHTTSEGEVEIQRIRAPAYEGDKSVSWEREVRTRKLPDGTVEKEFVLRNPDGSGQLAPVQIVREKSTPGANESVVQRETLERPGGTDWQTVRREHTTERGPDDAKEASKEVQRLNLTTHEWEIVERGTSTTSTRTAGGTTEKEIKSVRQTPGAYGTLTDFERRQERIVSTDSKQSIDSTVYRRDDSTTEPGHFYLLDHTATEVTATGSGTTTRDVVRKSDLLYGGVERNPNSLHPEVIEKRSSVEKISPNGSSYVKTKVSGRTSGEPSAIRPIYTLIENSDSAGYVRRIYIPAN
jgi:hypothetical protein